MAELRFEAPETVRFQPGNSARTETVEIADVTGDGRSDLLAATGVFGGENEHSLFVLEQLPDGTLTEPARYDTSGEHTEDWMGLSTGDFNADGRRDVAVATFQGINLFFQTVEGDLDGPHFPTMVSGDEGETAGYPPRSRYLVAGDIDGDGLDDIVATTNAPGQGGSLCNGIAYLHQTAGGGFEGTPLAVGLCTGEVELGDLNGDGRTDIVAGRFLFTQQPDGSFQQQELPFGGTIEVADVSDDGRADVIVGWEGPFGARVRVLRQDTLGQLGNETSCPHATTYWIPIEAGDIDGDGLTDIVSGDDAGVFLQRDDGSLGERIPIDLRDAGIHVDNVAIGDLNSDGRADIATAGVDSISIARQAADSESVEPEPCDMEAPEVDLETTAGVIELDPEGFAPLPFHCPEQESRCAIHASVRTAEPVLFNGRLETLEFGDAGVWVEPGDRAIIWVWPGSSEQREIWQLLSDLHELPMIAEVEARDEEANGSVSEHEFVLRTPTGYESERRTLTVTTGAGKSVSATPGFYRCIPHPDGSRTCVDRRPRPLPTSESFRARGCDVLSLESGYPIWRSRAVLESSDGSNLRQLEVAATSVPRVHKLHLPPGISRRADRIHVFVRHRDMNRGDFEATLRRGTDRCSASP